MTVPPIFPNFADQKFNFSSGAIFFWVLAISFSSCFDYVPQEDDATPYIVNFTFSKPSSTIATKNQYLPIEIQFDRNPSGYVHNVKVEVLDEKNVLVEKLFERNVHTFKTYTYSQINAFKPVVSGSFKIRASTTDENGKQENRKELVLMVQ